MTLEITNAQVIGWEINGLPKAIKVNQAWTMITTNIELEVWAWNVEGMSAVNKFGLNPAVWTSYEAIWDFGWAYPYLTTASILTIVSTEIEDTLLWDWARTVSIQWLNADYEEITEVVELNWITDVLTTELFLRVFRMKVLTAWVSEGAEWIITAKVSWVVRAQIDNWNNQTLMALYTIPAWKTWYLLFWKASLGQWKEWEIRFRARPLGWVFNLKHKFYAYENNYEYKFQIPMKLEEKTDLLVDWKCWLDTGVSAVFDIILIDN